MTEPSLPELEALRDRLYARLAALGDFRRGSVSENYRKCGKANCACAAPDHRGHGPRFLWTRSAGRRKTVGRQLAAALVVIEVNVGRPDGREPGHQRLFRLPLTPRHDRLVFFAHPAVDRQAARCRHHDLRRPVNAGDHLVPVLRTRVMQRHQAHLHPCLSSASGHGRAAGRGGTAAGPRACARRRSRAHRQRCAAASPHRVPRRSRSRC
jgi:hypothetical protein